MSDVTQTLQQIEDGDPTAAEQLLPLVYDELRELAAARMANESPAHMLQATALVHEAYIRLVDGRSAQHWDSRGHFFSAAAEAMRRILVEQARKRARRDAIRGHEVPLEELSLVTSCPSEQLLRVDEQLQVLERRHPSSAAIVKLRFFAGLTMEQAAQALQMSTRTAERNWTYARTWLHRALERCSAGDAEIA